MLKNGSILLLLSLALDSPPLADRCTCKPHIQADGVGETTCSVAKDDSKWCEIRFSGASEKPSSNFTEDLSRLSNRGLVRELALQRLGTVPPEDWNREFVIGFIPAMLEDVVPAERLKSMTEVLGHAASDILPALKTRSHTFKEFPLRGYQTVVSYGCVDFVAGDFSAMVKSQFSEATDRCRWK